MGSRELLWPTFIGLFSVVIIHTSETQRVHLFGESTKTSFDNQYTQKPIDVCFDHHNFNFWPHISSVE